MKYIWILFTFSFLSLSAQNENICHNRTDLSVENLENIIENVLKSNQKTILIAFYNNQNQRSYIGVKLD